MHVQGQLLPPQRRQPLQRVDELTSKRLLIASRGIDPNVHAMRQQLPFDAVAPKYAVEGQFDSLTEEPSDVDHVQFQKGAGEHHVQLRAAEPKASAGTVSRPHVSCNAWFGGGR